MALRALSRVQTRRLTSQAHAIPVNIPKEPPPFPIPHLNPPKVVWPNINMAIQQLPRQRLTRHTLPCVLMRAGTSKGMFIHRRDLPLNSADWAPHLISALGSRGCDPRQIDGVGGGTSTTSKVAVVSPSQRPDADVDFTFVQVAVGKESVDLSGNCGNMVSGVGPFAVQEGLVVPQPGATSVSRFYGLRRTIEC